MAAEKNTDEREDQGPVQERRLNWDEIRRQQPITMIPTPQRMMQPHTVVDLRNDDPKGQSHIVISRHKTGVELKGGQTVRGVEMLDSELEYFKKLSRRRLGPNGQILPRHPIVVIGQRTVDEESDRLEQEEANRREGKGVDNRALHARRGRPRLLNVEDQVEDERQRGNSEAAGPDNGEAGQDDGGEDGAQDNQDNTRRGRGRAGRGKGSRPALQREGDDDSNEN